MIEHDCKKTISSSCHSMEGPTHCNKPCKCLISCSAEDTIPSINFRTKDSVHQKKKVSIPKIPLIQNQLLPQVFLSLELFLMTPKIDVHRLINSRLAANRHSQDIILVRQGYDFWKFYKCEPGIFSGFQLQLIQQYLYV